MNREDLRVGVTAGILAATATAGALIAVGRRASTAARPFNTIAAHVVGASRAGAYGFVPSVTITGIALHVLLVVAAALFVAIIVRRRFASAWVASFVIASLAALVSVGIARRGGSGLASLLTVGDLILVYVTLAVSLAMGIRFALSDASTSRDSRIEMM